MDQWELWEWAHWVWKGKAARQKSQSVNFGGLFQGLSARFSQRHIGLGSGIREVAMHTAHSISQPEVSSNNRRLGCSQMASIEYHTLHIFHSRFGFRAMQSVCDNVYMTFLSVPVRSTFPPIIHTVMPWPLTVISRPVAVVVATVKGKRFNERPREQLARSSHGMQWKEKRNASNNLQTTAKCKHCKHSR